jgi:fatty acid desaturase
VCSPSRVAEGDKRANIGDRFVAERAKRFYRLAFAKLTFWFALSLALFGSLSVIFLLLVLNRFALSFVAVVLLFTVRALCCMCFHRAISTPLVHPCQLRQFKGSFVRSHSLLPATLDFLVAVGWKGKPDASIF